MSHESIDILLVEDNPAEARLIAESLREYATDKPFIATSAERLDDALAHLERGSFDVVLLDLTLPDSSGLSTVERLKGRFPGMPIVVLTGNRDDRLAIEAVKIGAQDYVVKGQADGNTLGRIIAYAIERKKNEESLKSATSLLGTILDTTSMAIAYLDRDLHFLRVNRAFADLHGRDVRSFRGESFFELHPESDMEQVFRAVVATGTPHYEYGKRYGCGKANGSDSFWDSSLVPTTDDDGRVTGLLFTLNDVTIQKKAEEQIKHSSELLEREVMTRTAELRGTNELLRMEIMERNRAEAALSKRQQVLESIYAMETTFSESLENTYDQTVLTISHLLEIPFAAVGQIERGAFKTIAELSGNAFSHEKGVAITAHPCGIVYRQKRVFQFSGDLASEFPPAMQGTGASYVSYVGVPITGKNGNLLGMICAMDVKSRRFDDYELHLIEIFARYIGHEIDREVMEEQLRSNREMNLLGSLTSGVAHEVRNPLNGILAISEALFQEIGDNPEYQPYLQHIRNQVNRLSALMKDLLDLGKPLVKSEFTVQPAEQLVRSTLDAFRLSSRHRDCTVALLLPPPEHPPLPVNADALKIQQVLLNLLDNACDHTPDDEEVTIELLEQDESYAVIRIADRGSGIPEEKLADVFKPFFTTRKGGTGLGLSIVRHIVSLHEGTVSLRNNTPLPGLTAEVRLPLVH